MTRNRNFKLRALSAIFPTIAVVTLLTAFAASAVAQASDSFLPPVAYGSGGSGSTSITVADVNGDGKPDVVVANCIASGNVGCGAEGIVGVLLGNGDGTFRPVVTYDSGGVGATSIAVADVNGDGKPDLVVANGGGSVGVLLGNGDGTFQPAVSYNSGGAFPDSVAVADVNGDGKLDVVVANYYNSAGTPIGVLLGNGDGTFQPVVSYGGAGLQRVTSLAVVDVNGDGKPDVVMACQCAGDCTSGAVGVLLGNGDGTFQATVIYPSGGIFPYSIAAADLNGDSKPDLVVANLCSKGSSCTGIGEGDGAVGVLLGNGDGTFRATVAYDSGGIYAFSVAVADVNGDGKPDLLVANDNSGTIGVLLGNGHGTFQTVAAYESGWPGSDSVAVGDLTGDGRLDVLAGGRDPGMVDVLLNNGGSTESPTTTTLTSPLNPSVYGQSVTFTVHVTANSGTPTGTVNLLDGSTQVGSGTLTNGSVSIAVSSLPVGANSMTAKYQGYAGFAPSTSTPLIQSVSLATTTTTLTSSLNPAATNQTVSFTATITSQFGAAATGSATFYSGSQTLGTASLSGNRATLTTSFAAAGTFSISAKYNGDANNLGSASSTLNQVIIAATTTALVSSLNPSLVGQAVTFTATVTSTSGTPPNGETITFNNGSAVLGTAPLGGGVASLTTSSLPAGIYTLTASYGGDANFAASTSPGLRQVVNSTTKYATSTTLASSLNPSIYGQRVVFTAVVTTTGPVPPTGKAAFTWGGMYTIGTAALNSSGVATLTKSNLNADAYPLTAVYKGDDNNLGSTSPGLNQVVQQTTSTASITSLPNPSTVGQVVTFTAKITSPTVMPTGPVTFMAGTTVLGTAQLSGGKATFTTTSLAAGSNVVGVIYDGDSNIKKSSAAVTQVVQP
ncbi:MAG: Ig-like domain repeat protein [Candidatus Sulfotelmatobacter sp.]